MKWAYCITLAIFSILLSSCGGSSSSASPQLRASVTLSVNWPQGRVIPPSTQRINVTLHDEEGTFLGLEKDIVRPASSVQIDNVPTGPILARSSALNADGRVLATGDAVTSVTPKDDNRIAIELHALGGNVIVGVEKPSYEENFYSTSINGGELIPWPVGEDVSTLTHTSINDSATSLAFTNGHHIYIRDLKTGITKTRLLSVDESDHVSTLSIIGNTIFFEFDDYVNSTTSESRLYKMPLSNGPMIPITNFENNGVINLCRSSDRTRLTYTQYLDRSQPEFYTYEVCSISVATNQIVKHYSGTARHDDPFQSVPDVTFMVDGVVYGFDRGELIRYQNGLRTRLGVTPVNTDKGVFEADVLTDGTVLIASSDNRVLKSKFPFTTWTTIATPPAGHQIYTVTGVASPE